MITNYTISSLSEALDYHENSIESQLEGDGYGAYLANGSDSKMIWGGKISEDLGLKGLPVDQAKFKEIYSGEHFNPATGQVEKIGQQDRRIAIDQTFTPDKSFSVGALVGGDERLMKIFEEAVHLNNQLCERDAAQYRKTIDGDVSYHLSQAGMICSTAFHLTDREDMPDIHGHTLWANETRDQDGKMVSITSEELDRGSYERNKIVNAFMESETKKIGYTINMDEHGNAKIVEYEKISIVMSVRTERANEWLKKNGIDPEKASRAEKNKAFQKTRAPKNTDKSYSQKLDSWRELENEAGVDTRKIVENARLRSNQSQPNPLDDQKEAFKSVSKAISHLSERTSGFSRKDLELQSVRFNEGKADFKTVMATIEKMIKSGDLLKKEVGEQGLEGFTTHAAVELERKTLSLLQGGVGKVRAIVGDDKKFHQYVDDFNKTKQEMTGNTSWSLTHEQVQAAKNVLMSENLAMAIQGNAGTGKTASFEFVKFVTDQENIKIIGLSATGKAAAGLQQETGVPSDTIAGYKLNKGKEAAKLRDDISKLKAKLHKFEGVDLGVDSGINPKTNDKEAEPSKPNEERSEGQRDTESSHTHGHDSSAERGDNASSSSAKQDNDRANGSSDDKSISAKINKAKIEAGAIRAKLTPNKNPNFKKATEKISLIGVIRRLVNGPKKEYIQHQSNFRTAGFGATKDRYIIDVKTGDVLRANAGVSNLKNWMALKEHDRLDKKIQDRRAGKTKLSLGEKLGDLSDRARQNVMKDSITWTKVGAIEAAVIRKQAHLKKPPSRVVRGAKLIFGGLNKLGQMAALGLKNREIRKLEDQLKNSSKANTGPAQNFDDKREQKTGENSQSFDDQKNDQFKPNKEPLAEAQPVKKDAVSDKDLDRNLGAKNEPKTERDTLVGELKEKLEQLKNLEEKGNVEGKDIRILVDEGGLMGSKDFAEIAEDVSKLKNGAFIVMGDTKQLSSPAAGSPFKQMQETKGVETSYIKEEMRFRDASKAVKASIKDFHDGKWIKSIENLKPVKVEEMGDKAFWKTVSNEYIKLKNDPRIAGKDVSFVTGTNADRNGINVEIRDTLKLSGEIEAKGFTKEINVDPKLTEAEKSHAAAWSEKKVTGVVSGRDYGSLGIAKGESLKVVGVDKIRNVISVKKHDGSIVKFDPVKIDKLRPVQIEEREFSNGEKIQARAPIGDKKITTLTGEKIDNPNRVVNGTIGTIKNVNDKGATVEWSVAGGKKLTTKLDNDALRKVDYGYGRTTMQEQGQSVGAEVTAISSRGVNNFKRDSQYVSITRAKIETVVVLGKDVWDKLKRVAGKENRVETAIDVNKEQRAWPENQKENGSEDVQRDKPKTQPNEDKELPLSSLNSENGKETAQNRPPSFSR